MHAASFPHLYDVSQTSTGPETSPAVRLENHVSWTCIRPTRQTGHASERGGVDAVAIASTAGLVSAGAKEPARGALDIVGAALALPIREEPIVPHPLKATRQDMQEKAPNEFDRVERHEAVAITPLIVFPSERHLAIVTGEEPSIGDGHAMCIAGKVAQDQLWPGQRGLRRPPTSVCCRLIKNWRQTAGPASVGTAPAY